MAGKKRLDVIEEKIAAAKAAKRGDALGAFLATLSDETLDHMERRLVAGDNPEAVLREVAGQ